MRSVRENKCGHQTVGGDISCGNAVSEILRIRTKPRLPSGPKETRAVTPNTSAGTPEVQLDANSIEQFCSEELVIFLTLKMGL